MFGPGILLNLVGLRFKFKISNPEQTKISKNPGQNIFVPNNNKRLLDTLFYSMCVFVNCGIET